MLKRVNYDEVVVTLVYSADALGSAAGLAFATRFFVIALSVVSASVLAPGFAAAISFLGAPCRDLRVPVGLPLYASSALIMVFLSGFAVALGASLVAVT